MVKHIILGQVKRSAERVRLLWTLRSALCDAYMSEASLKNPELSAEEKTYAVHPAHVEVANTKVRPYTVQRTCIDFEV